MISNSGVIFSSFKTAYTPSLSLWISFGKVVLTALANSETSPEAAYNKVFSDNPKSLDACCKPSAAFCKSSTYFSISSPEYTSSLANILYNVSLSKLSKSSAVYPYVLTNSSWIPN